MGGNCAPKTCCTCHEEPSTRDACMCGCGYLNGVGPVIGSQMLVLIGLLFSLSALGDCSFVALDERLFLPDNLDVDLPIEVTQTQYIGFLTWQRLDGTCYWYNTGNNPQNQVQQYFDLLGDEWNVARILGGLSASLSFYMFCYLLSFVCSSQVRGVRYFNVFFMCCVLTTLQGLTFLVFRTELCEEMGCTFGRGAGFSVASMFAFFMGGLCFLMTKDYPGDRAIGSEKAQGNASPADEEEGTQKRDALEEEEEVEVIEEEVVPEGEEEEIIEEEVIDEYEEEEEEPGKVEEQDTANIQTVDSRLKDAEA
ncbi:hypothetical protein IV203_007988 [Nitzschia inconspicua]|uniref:Uncharacterized protein n=1 Tax=Nitzschia inconspicua TaxID=303405 RepID=A0A9K3PLJ2_9STRA|nr:hypothetical protein IV203_007988 [Nitzschia inconspicua]